MKWCKSGLGNPFPLTSPVPVTLIVQGLKTYLLLSRAEYLLKQLHRAVCKTLLNSMENQQLYLIVEYLTN